MKTKAWETVLERVESWPLHAQVELASVAQETEAQFGSVYGPTPEELRMLEEVRAAVKRGEVATKEEVEAVLTKYRRK